MLNSNIVKGLVIAMIAFIFVGIGVLVGGPIMLEGFDASINATNASTFTAFTTIAKFGPALIILGFIVMVAIGAFLGIKISGKK
jgi:ABC-type antimicrobial peptide transport system permease subunit